MTNKERAGHRYPAYRYEVGRAKIEEYATATGYPVAAGDADEPLTAPNMFAACFTVMRGAALLREDVELDGKGPIVHAGQDYDFGRTVKSGDVLVCSPHITEIEDRGAHTYLTLSIECVDAESSEHVVTSRQSIAYLGAATTEGKAS